MERHRDRTGAGTLVSDYVSELASAIRAHVPVDRCPDEPHRDRLFRLYAVLALGKGLETTAEDVHNAWVAWMVELDPNHPALRPFSELGSEETQQDAPFLEAIRSVASTIHPG